MIYYFCDKKVDIFDFNIHSLLSILNVKSEFPFIIIL
jgi:hypothetical protein